MLKSKDLASYTYTVSVASNLLTNYYSRNKSAIFFSELISFAVSCFVCTVPYRGENITNQLLYFFTAPFKKTSLLMRKARGNTINYSLKLEIEKIRHVCIAL